MYIQRMTSINVCQMTAASHRTLARTNSASPCDSPAVEKPIISIGTALHAAEPDSCAKAKFPERRLYTAMFSLEQNLAVVRKRHP